MRARGEEMEREDQERVAMLAEDFDVEGEEEGQDGQDMEDSFSI